MAKLCGSLCAKNYIFFCFLPHFAGIYYAIIRSWQLGSK